jgi:hypothetical protein
MDETVGIILQARDQASAVIAKVRGEIKGMDATTTAGARSFGVLGKASQGLGGSLTHLHSQVGRLIGVAGLAGLTGGVLGLAAAIKGTIGEAESFGVIAGRIATVTGQTNQQSQLLLATMQHFNVDTESAVKVLGMLSKNMFAHGKTVKDAASFQKTYGLSLLDSTGHLVDQQTMLQRLGDYMNNGHVPALQRDAAMTALLGRQWQTLLPMLQAGSAGMKSASDEAKALGLGQEDLVTLAQQQEAASRDFKTSLDALKITIGAQLLPEVTKITKAFSQWLANPANRAMIHEWVQGLITGGEHLVSFFRDEVFPTVKSLFDTANAFWNGLPSGLRDLLVKGFVADRVIKFLFGFSVEDIVGNVAKGMLSSMGSMLAQTVLGRGSPANPMFVVDESGGGGAGGLLGRGGGILGKLLGGGLLAGGLATQAGLFGGGHMGDAQSYAGPLATIAGAVIMGGPIWGAIVAVGEAVKTGFDFMNTRDAAQASLQGAADAAANQTSAQALANLQNLNQTLGNQGLWESLVTNTFGAAQSSEAMVNLANAAVSGAHLDANQTQQAIAALQAAQQLAISRGWTDAAQAIGYDIDNLRFNVNITVHAGETAVVNPYTGQTTGYKPNSPFTGTPTSQSGTMNQGHYDSDLGMWVPGDPATKPHRGGTGAAPPPGYKPPRYKPVDEPKAPAAGSKGMSVQERIDAILSSLPSHFAMSKAAMEHMAQLAGVSADRIGKAWATLREHMSEATAIVKQLPKDFNMTASAAQALAHGTKLSADQIMQAFSQLHSAVNKAASGIVNGLKSVLAGLPDGFKLTAAALKNLEDLTGKGAGAITKLWQHMQAQAQIAQGIVAKLPKGYQMTLDAATMLAKGTGTTAQDIMDAYTKIQSTLDNSGPPPDEPVYQVGADGKIHFMGFRHFGGAKSKTTTSSGDPVTPPDSKVTPPRDTPETASPLATASAFLKAHVIHLVVTPQTVNLIIDAQKVAQAIVREQQARYGIYTSPEGPYPASS